MATLIQIGEGTELVKRAARLEPKEPLTGTAPLKSTAFFGTTALLEDTELLEDTASQPERQPVTANDLHNASHFILILLRTLVGALIAPILLAAALVVFFFALADFSWFRLRDLHNGHPHPKGLWEF